MPVTARFSDIIVDEVQTREAAAARSLKNQNSSLDRKQLGNSQQGIILETRTEIEEEEKDHCSQPMTATVNNQYFGISYHLDSHLLVKTNDYNKDNTCNENPEEENLSLEGEKEGSSCMVTPNTEIIHLTQKKKKSTSSLDKQE